MALQRRVYMAGSKGAVLFCLHGCGYTGLTWSLIAAAVKDRCASLQAALVMATVQHRVALLALAH